MFPFQCPLMWEWHDSRYWGAAHGVTGILFTLLAASPDLLSADSKWNKPILTTIDYLVKAFQSSTPFSSPLPLVFLPLIRIFVLLPLVALDPF